MPILERIKHSYIQWYGYYQTIPKTHRYTLGGRVDSCFIDLIEAISAASFLSAADKHPYVRLGIRKLDTLKVLLLVLWETRSLETKKYAVLSTSIDEVGRMLGGWNGQLIKQNSA